jgi:hypothetical protein
MTNVKRIFFLTKEEATKVGAYVLCQSPHYELEDGTILYTCGVVADCALEQWTSTDGTVGGRDIKMGLESKR